MSASSPCPPMYAALFAFQAGRSRLLLEVQRGLSGAADCQDGRTRSLHWLSKFIRRNTVETLRSPMSLRGALVSYTGS